MKIRDELLEALMDKGYPRIEAYRIISLMMCVPDWIKIIDPYIYTDSKSVENHYKGWDKVYKNNSKEFLISVRYMKPVWNQFSSWHYEI